MAIKNFNYCNPVRILFGQDQVKKISRYVPQNSKVLLIYGGESAKKYGTLDKVKEALSGYDVGEFGGIPANPTYEKCMEAVKLIYKEGYNFLIAVGGGSVIDATKFISVAVYEEKPEDFFFWGDNKEKIPTEALPFGTVLTLPATGSEMNNGSVITFVEKGAKYSFSSELTFPKFSVLDPTLTYTLPKKQLANGIIDTYVHVMEQYLTYPIDAKLQDYQAEAVLKTLIEIAPKVIEEGNTDYNVRANFMWAATNGLNNYLSVGVPQDWATHVLGHELTLKYGIDHGQTLAIIMPSMMSVMRDEKKDKILQYAKNVFAITQGTEQEIIDKAIDKTREFFESLGVSTHLKDYGVKQEELESIVKHLDDHGRGTLGETGKVTVDRISKIYNMSM